MHAFKPVKGGAADVGLTKLGKGMKIMAMMNRYGLPLSVWTYGANEHGARLVNLCFDLYSVKVKPRDGIGDCAYGSDDMDVALCDQGIEMTAPHRRNRRKTSKKKRRRLRRSRRRWLVECLVALLGKSVAP